MKKQLCLATAATLMVVMVVLVGVGGVEAAPPQRPNQRQPSTSPSGHYVLSVPIERPMGKDDACWTVTIQEPNGRTTYADTDSTFAGRFNVYWVWDPADRVWLYNSDDGAIYFWERAQDRWHKHQYNPSQARLTPPDELFPSYARPKMLKPATTQS